MLKVLIQIHQTFKTTVEKGYSYLFHLILFYDCHCLVDKQTSDVHVLGRRQ